jgi:hypothetical protein
MEGIQKEATLVYFKLHARIREGTESRSENFRWKYWYSETSDFRTQAAYNKHLLPNYVQVRLFYI